MDVRCRRGLGADEFGAAEDQQEVRRGARVGGARGVTEALAQLGQPLPQPLGDLGQPVVGAAEFGRGGRGGGPWQPEPLGHQAPAKACWSATTTSGRNSSTAARTPGAIASASGSRYHSHRNFSASAPRSSGGARRLRRPAPGPRSRTPGRRGPQAGAPARVGAGPGHPVAPRGEPVGDPDGRVDVPGQRRYDEQEAAHRTALAPARIRSRMCPPTAPGASTSTECSCPGSTTDRKSGSRASCSGIRSARSESPP